MMRNIDTAIRRSVQEFPEATGFGHFLISIAAAGDIIPAWGENQPYRDQALREFYPTEPWLASTTASLARNAAFSWTLEGPQRTCNSIQEMLHLSDFGKGWVSLLLKISADLYTQDNGAFIELVRDGKGPNSPLLCLAHLDSARCTRTGNPDFPVTYVDLQGGQHKLAWFQVLTLTDMPSPIESMRGVGMCAVSRVLRAAQILRDTALRTHEKLTGRFAGNLNIVSGITMQMIEDAMVRAGEESDNRNRMRYQPPFIVGTLDPNAEVKVATIHLADVPEEMDEENERKWYIATLALAFGCEYQDLAPLPGGNLGTSQQSETLHLQAKGKGPELFQKLITHALNFYVLPKNVTFKFDEKDYQAEEIEGGVKKLRAEALKVYVDGGIITPQVARQIMEDDGDLKHEYLEMMTEPDMTPEGEVDDEGRETDMPPVEGQSAPTLLPDEQPNQLITQRLEKELADPEYWERLIARLEKEYEAEAAKLLEDMGERIGKRLKREMA
jgi:hypothetical protein